MNAREKTSDEQHDETHDKTYEESHEARRMKIGETNVFLQSDDYGESYNTSRDILELVKKGHLDGISVITNMKDHEKYRDMFVQAVPEMKRLPYITLHLDLVEGRLIGTSPSASDEIPSGPFPDDGPGPDDLIPWTWKSLFLLSLHIPVRDANGNRMSYGKVLEQLKTEIACQLRRGYDFISEAQSMAEESGVEYEHQNYRIDSHQHAHLIPIVWKALTYLIDKNDLSVDHIRTAHEPLWPFIQSLGFGRGGIKPIGLVKNRILAILAPKAERYLKARDIKPAYLWGLIMTGHMDLGRIDRVMPHMLKVCEKKDYDLELNIHPGTMLPGEVTDEIPRESADEFYLSENRAKEAETARAFHAWLKNQF